MREAASRALKVEARKSLRSVGDDDWDGSLERRMALVARLITGVRRVLDSLNPERSVKQHYVSLDTIQFDHVVYPRGLRTKRGIRPKVLLLSADSEVAKLRERLTRRPGFYVIRLPTACKADGGKQGCQT